MNDSFVLTTFRIGGYSRIEDWDFGTLTLVKSGKIMDLTDFKSIHDTNIDKIKIVESPDPERPGFYLYHTGFERFILNSARFINVDAALSVVNSSLMFSDWNFGSDLYSLIGTPFFSQYKFLKETILPTLKNTKQIY